MSMYRVLLVMLCCASFGLSATKQVSPAMYWEQRGDAAVAKKNEAHALVAWLRAERVAGLMDRVRLVNKRLALSSYAKQAPLQRSLRKTWELFKTVVALFPLLVLQFMLVLLLFGAAFIVGRRGVRWLLAQHFLAILGICLVVCAVIAAKEHDAQVLAVLLKPHASLTSGPSENFPIVTSMAGPAVLEVCGSANNHVKVARNGQFGWVLKDVIEVI